MTAGLTHGAIAQVRRAETPDELVLAQYCDHDGDGDAHWCYFGTDWTDRPEDVTVVNRALVVLL
ncbi:hypothetical protein ALI22I_34085 [Saccharothrix sp. ALI-22-I]|uniref:hypothetical protein n=1 Tax=Saccharothrix sp. ALI-22-I TaxID=1933778 RepID=UPI00097BDE04|nr:hypothetical protein [Saccharothrix sp. ALI-22-I]ONI83522.1 hypothetical protein ALI22I_34085 [Saccharothrix sp. ALI-22-I]